MSISYRARRVRWSKRLGWFAGAIVAVIAGLVIIYLVYLVFLPVSDYIAEHDVGTITGPGRAAALQAARDAARNRMLAALAGLVALGALLYTARTFSLSREGQVTDRFAKAVGQLGDTSLEVRVGAIYALELIVRDSRRNQEAVMELLAAFAREQSKAQTSASAKHVPSAKRSGHIRLPHVHDVHTAVAVIGRRKQNRKNKVDLRYTKLAGTHLDWAHLRNADLTGADLTGTHLAWARLRGADLTGADLTGADLTKARLSGAVLKEAHLKDAHLKQANLATSDLTGADLTGADLTGADVLLPMWPGADFTGALWPADVKAPDGWRLDDTTGRLKRADANPGNPPTDPAP